MEEFDDREIARLLRLKRYEQPPPGYFESFLHEFHRRQRDELLRQPLWRICLERAHAFTLGLNVGSLVSYPAAVTAVLVCAAVISLKIYQQPETARVALQSLPASSTPVSAGGELYLAWPASLHFLSTQPARTFNASAQPHRAAPPCYVLDSVAARDEPTPAVPIGKTEELAVATPVVAIGFPLDLQETPNLGMIAGFDRKCLGRYFSTIHLRVNVPTQRGEAGAPLLNMRGEVVGIIVSSLENNSSCYAVPIEAAEKIRNDFVRFGETRHGWVGVNQLTEAPEPAGGSRACVTQITVGTPASKCGMKEGDVLLQLGQKKICEPEDVFDASFYITAGEMVPITVMRGDKKLTFHVQADLHPVSKNVPMLPDGTEIPTAADANRSIFLKLESEAQHTP